MKYQRFVIVAMALLSTLPSVVRAQGAGIKWETLNQETIKLLLANQYDRAVVLA